MSNVPKNIENIIQDVINGINNLLGDRVKKIILYGSYARGDYNKNSDIDIMILTDCNFEEIELYRDVISDFVYDIELETGYIISPVIKNIDKYTSRVNIIPFYRNVEKEGVILLNG
jgi:predicted nucleotidyltransferase